MTQLEVAPVFSEETLNKNILYKKLVGEKFALSCRALGKLIIVFFIFEIKGCLWYVCWFVHALFLYLYVETKYWYTSQVKVRTLYFVKKIKDNQN